jgi:GT2 family glycosyltransferase
MSKLSVHIVTFNSQEHIVPCLEAVFRQSYPVEQVIVVDNASTDQTLERLSHFEHTIHIICNDMNRGFAEAHNQAIALSEKEYFIILNPDVILDKHYVARIVNFLNDNPEIGSATGKLLLEADHSIIDSTGLIMKKSRRAFDRGAGDFESDWDDSAYVFGVSGAAAIYTRNMVIDISINGQFFDEDFFAYKEDVDVAWRAQLLGWKSYYCAEAVAYHARGWKQGSRKKQPLFIRKYSYINRYYMLLKNESLISYIAHCPYIITYDVVMFGYLLIREFRVLTAWFSLIKRIPSMLRKRKHIRNKKKSLSHTHNMV